jgi:uncharacterized LabA/DUF88 family protein
MANFAFIDSQNINLGVQSLGWKLDWRRFRVYLRDKYDVATAFSFIGFIVEYQPLYTALQQYGYVLVFKEILKGKAGTKPKGNVDADLVLKTMIEYPNYERAIIVTSDGDFQSLVGYLYQNGKLETVLSPDSASCSALLKRAAKERLHFFDTLRGKLEHKP